jgi:hypothetical protein
MDKMKLKDAFWLVTIFAATTAALFAAEPNLVNYNLHAMRGYGKCRIELTNAPMEFLNESFDGNHKSGFGVGGDGKCIIKAHLSDPIEIRGINLSFFMGRDLGGVEWTLSELDEKGQVKSAVLTHRTTVLEKPDNVILDKPAKLKDFQFEFTKLLTDQSPAPKGNMDFRIGELEIMVPNKPIIYVATPNEKWLFEPGFYPFTAGVGRDIAWTGWTITSGGKRVQTVRGVKFTSSNPKVAVMNGPVMKTLAPGKTMIRAEHPDGMSHEVPVTVLAKGQAGVDLDVIRLTRLVYSDETGKWEILSRRGQKQYPIKGDRVRYRAEVVNLGQDTAQNIAATWTVDGKTVKLDKLASLKPAGELVESGEFLTPERNNPLMVHQNRTTFYLDTTWQKKRQQIGIAVRAGVEKGERGEINPDNNRMAIATDSLCFAYYTTELGYHRFTNAQQEGLKAGGIPSDTQAKLAKEWGQRAKFWREDTRLLSSSIYDYIYRTCRAWDDQCEISKYPLTPNGVTTRFRSKVVVVKEPESAEATWGEGGGRAVWADEEADVSWGWIADATFPWDECMNADYVRKNYTSGAFMFVDFPMLHEASHAHGLVDLYIAPMKNNEVVWKDAAGNRLWPDDRGGICDMRKRWTRNGYMVGRGVMMDGDYINGYSEHSAYAMERMATKRGRFIPCNNCSGNASFGDFFNEVAEHNILELWTTDGKPLVGAKVEVAKRIDSTGFCHETPDIVGVTNEKGQFDLGNNPVDWPENTAPVPSDIPFATAYYQMHHRGATGSDHSAIRITTKDGKRFYKFLNSFDLNLAYWYNYGIEPNGWPIATPLPYSKVVISFTVDPSISETEAVKMENSGEVPTFGSEPSFEGKTRAEYAQIQGWRKIRDGE